MIKNLLLALKRLNLSAQSAELGVTLDEICAQLSEFTGGCVLVVDARGRVLAQMPRDERHPFKTKESLDGRYIDSRISDRLRELTALEEQLWESAAVLPLYAGTERVATIIVCGVKLETPDRELLYAAGAVILMIIRCAAVLEASGRRRDADAVKQAVGMLSYSELSAVLRVFDELGGDEGLLVVGRIADGLGITRSIVVNALRKLEGAAVIETRSLGVKGTHIKVLNPMLQEELFRIRN